MFVFIVVLILCLMRLYCFCCVRLLFLVVLLWVSGWSRVSLLIVGGCVVVVSLCLLRLFGLMVRLVLSL